jgi:hypothetical protein
MLSAWGTRPGDKSKTLGYTFTHRKVKKLILRFSSSRGRPILKIKFFASQSYSKFFHEAIRTVIEEYDYKYTGCYGCGNCDGTQGYKYKYPDGREYYRCGTELIDITDIRNVPVTEILVLLKKQHDFLCGQPAKSLNGSGDWPALNGGGLEQDPENVSTVSISGT